MQIRSNQTMKYAIAIFFFILQYQPMLAQTEVDSLETVYLKFQIFKPVHIKFKDTAHENNMNNALMQFHIGFIKVENKKNTISFHRTHRTVSVISDQFVFDKTKYKPKRISQKELSKISFVDFDELEKRSRKEHWHYKPTIILPSITIVTVEKNKGIYLYEHVVWKREVTSDD